MANLERSNVEFMFSDSFGVEEDIDYKDSLGIHPIFDSNALWIGVSTEIVHDANDSPYEIIEQARRKIRNLLTLISVAVGCEISIKSTCIRFMGRRPSSNNTCLKGICLDALIIRSLESMPKKALVERLNNDSNLRRQCEALVAAKSSSSDVISKIRWAYMVLEQEVKRNSGYRPPSEFKFIRDSVSHPVLDNPAAKSYFQDKLGVDFPDLFNPRHMKFLKQKSELMLEAATELVEMQLEDKKFWK